MKNLEYEPWTTKYLIVLPILIILWWIGLLCYRIYGLNIDWFSAFISNEFWFVSPLVLIFWWIVLFFIIFCAQSFEKKMDKLDDKKRQQELRNKVVKDFRVCEKKEKTHIIFYTIVWLLSLTAYVLIASNDEKAAKELVLFFIIWVFVPITQAVKLWKYVKYLKLKKLRLSWECLEWKIIQIKKKWRWFLRDNTMKYQIVAKSNNDWDKEYKSQITRFNLPSYLEEWDKINIYVDNNSDDYFVDIESSFKLH